MRRPFTGIWTLAAGERRGHFPLVALMLGALSLAGGGALMAQPVPPPPARAEVAPDAFQGVGVDEHLGARLPLEMKFVDENGKTVQLGDYFKSGKPVVLQLGYYRCPMLCGMVWQGLVDSLKQVDLTLGKDFNVVNLSIDPKENWRLASAKKQSFLEAYGKPDEGGLTLLTGEEEPIKQVAAVVGFKYKWIAESREFSHPAVLMVITPDGRVSRYLYGVSYPSKTLRLSLVEASEKKIGTTMDQVLLICFHYDPSVGRYTVAAQRLMTAAGAATVLVIGVVLWRLFRRDARVRSAMPGEPGISTPSN